MGLGVSQIYACAITDYAYLKDIVEDNNSAHARYLAERQITLSTSRFLQTKDLNYIVEIIQESS